MEYLETINNQPAPSSAEISSKLDRILLSVQKPGRYVGGELNQIVKDWDMVGVRTALLFPDIYDIGVQISDYPFSMT